MRSPRRLASLFATLVLAVLLGAVAYAHHSRAGYDTAKEHLTTQTAVVTEVIWRNPHVYLLWDARDESRCRTVNGRRRP